MSEKEFSPVPQTLEGFMFCEGLLKSSKIAGNRLVIF
jgi:hypothetical protein